MSFKPSHGGNERSAAGGRMGGWWCWTVDRDGGMDTGGRTQVVAGFPGDVAIAARTDPAEQSDCGLETTASACQNHRTITDNFAAADAKLPEEVGDDGNGEQLSPNSAGFFGFREPERDELEPLNRCAGQASHRILPGELAVAFDKPNNQGIRQDVNPLPVPADAATPPTGTGSRRRLNLAPPGTSLNRYMPERPVAIQFSRFNL